MAWPVMRSRAARSTSPHASVTGGSSASSGSPRRVPWQEQPAAWQLRGMATDAGLRGAGVGPREVITEGLARVGRPRRWPVLEAAHG